jgi:exodeoxyribonuclease-3
MSVSFGLNGDNTDDEGRVITLEYPGFYLVNVYVPNSQGGLERWYYRLDFDSMFSEYADGLRKRKDTVICGDFNVARSFIDVYPENLRNIEKPYGFSTEERDGFEALLDLGFSDVYRKLNPEKERAYTWWSQRLNKRRENRGWRIDYFLVSESLMPKVVSCGIRDDIYGSDHAPLELEVGL